MAKTKGKIQTFYPKTFKLPMVAPDDIGEFASKLMREDARLTGLHHFEGPERYSSLDVAKAFSRALGKPIDVEVIPKEKWIPYLLDMGYSNSSAKSMANMTEYTLNNLYALTLKKDDKAPEVIAKLSEILDFVLYRCNEDYVSIEKEITMIEHYIALEKLRYDENRLDILFTKAIQHSSKISPLIILIRLHLESSKEAIIFSIENTKPQNDLALISDKSKIGLENIRKQLDLLYPQKHQLAIEETQQSYSVKLCLKS
ncbi:MAG: hypothetical protein EOO93_31745 [Pedobacter sp.]|nr:MAG: hypothetical protein EOO93_31745 [Pedobacter sp.]